MSASLRLFVAIYPPGDLTRAMLVAASELGLPGPRWVPAEQVHLTLQFIGKTPVKELDSVAESVERSCSGLAGFELAPERIISLPARSPRLIAATTDGPPSLLEIQRRLAQRLARGLGPRAGDRFLPHLTLARFPKGARVPRVDKPLGLGPFAVGEVLLMRSVLGPSGARHELVSAVRLSPS